MADPRCSEEALRQLEEEPTTSRIPDAAGRASLALTSLARDALFDIRAMLVGLPSDAFTRSPGVWRGHAWTEGYTELRPNSSEDGPAPAPTSPPQATLCHLPAEPSSRAGSGLRKGPGGSR